MMPSVRTPFGRFRRTIANRGVNQSGTIDEFGGTFLGKVAFVRTVETSCTKCSAGGITLLTGVKENTK